MKVIEKSHKKLVIKDSQSTNIGISIILLSLGSITCTAILFSGEPFFPTAILPCLFLIGGAFLYRRYTHPYLLIFDGYKDLMILKTPRAGHLNYEEKRIPLERIKKANLDTSIISAGTAYGIIIKMTPHPKKPTKEKDCLQVFPYLKSWTAKKKVNRIVTAINLFLEDQKN